MKTKKINIKEAERMICPLDNTHYAHVEKIETGKDFVRKIWRCNTCDHGFSSQVDEVEN